MAKAITAGAVGSDAGNTVSWRVAVQNAGNTTAYRVNWSDVLPGGLYQISNVAVSTSGGSVYRNGTTTAPVAGDAMIGTTTNTNDTVALPLLQLDPGASLTITFDTVVMDTVTPGQVLNNTTAASYTSLVGGGRDGSGGGDDDVNDRLNNYQESASQALTIASAIAVNKTVLPASATIGQDVTYTVRIDLIEGLTPSLLFSDVLPAGLTYRSHSISVGHLGLTIGNPTYNTRIGSGQTVQFDLGNVSNPTNGINTDDYILITIVARVDNSTANQNAVILRNGQQADGSSVNVLYGLGPTQVNFDYDAGTPGLQGVPLTLIEPNLSVTKAANPTAQSLGDVVTFTVTVQHNGASTANAYDLVLNDVLPAGLTYVPGSATLPAPDVTAAGQNLQFRFASVTLAEGSKAFTYQAKVDLGAPVGTPLTNTIALTYKSLPGGTGAADSGRTGDGGLNDYLGGGNSSVTPNTLAFIDALKTVTDLNGGTLQPGEPLQYAITLRNTGGSGVTNVVFSDQAPAQTTYVPGSLATTQGAVNEAGAPTLTVAVGSLAPGASVTIHFHVTVNSGTPAGSVISNQGLVNSDQTVPEPTDADGNDANGDQPTDIIVGGPPNLPNGLYAVKQVVWVTDADGSSSITANDRMRYLITLNNTGAVPLTNVRLTDTIPANLTYVGGTVGATQGGSAAVIGQAVSVTGMNLPVGAQATVQFEVTVGAAGTYVNQGTVGSDQTVSGLTDGNGDPSDGEQPTTFVAVASGSGTPQVNLQKRWRLLVDLDGNGAVNPNDTVEYTLTLINSGSGSATNVHLTDTLPGQLTLVNGSVTAGQGVVVSETPIDINLGHWYPADSFRPHSGLPSTAARRRAR